MRTRTEPNAAVPTGVQDRPDTNANMPLYSGIAASRPPSPRKENSSSPVEPVEHTSDEVDSEGAFGYSRTKENVVRETHGKCDKRDYTSSEEQEFPQRKEELWKTVRRRRAHSLDSVSRVQNVIREKET